MRKFYIMCGFAAALTAAVPANGQTLRGTVSKVAGNLVNHLSGLDLEGTWEYSGSSVAFESDNLLKKAGGALAAHKIEEGIDGQLGKIGFTPGVTSFTFREDGSFTNYINGRTVPGTYEYDPATGYLILKYLNHVPMKAKLSGSGRNISLLFESGGFLSFVSFLGGHSGSSILGGVSSIADSYDGMLMGIELRKR